LVAAAHRHDLGGIMERTPILAATTAVALLTGAAIVAGPAAATPGELVTDGALSTGAGPNTGTDLSNNARPGHSIRPGNTTGAGLSDITTPANTTGAGLDATARVFDPDSRVLAEGRFFADGDRFELTKLAVDGGRAYLQFKYIRTDGTFHGGPPRPG
jgi:hypothetical protein